MLCQGCILCLVRFITPTESIQVTERTLNDETVLIQNICNIAFAMCVYQEQAKQLLKHARI